MDAVIARLLAGVVTDATRVRDHAVAKADLETVMAMENIITRVVSVERRLSGMRVDP